jgi:hypothetical protein
MSLFPPQREFDQPNDFFFRPQEKEGERAKNKLKG